MPSHTAFRRGGSDSDVFRMVGTSVQFTGTQGSGWVQTCLWLPESTTTIGFVRDAITIWRPVVRARRLVGFCHQKSRAAISRPSHGWSEGRWRGFRRRFFWSTHTDILAGGWSRGFRLHRGRGACVQCWPQPAVHASGWGFTACCSASARRHFGQGALHAPRRVKRHLSSQQLSPASHAPRPASMCAGC